MTIIFECRDIKKKKLFLQFKFESHNIEVGKNRISGHSLDKFFSLDTWTTIYQRLDNYIEHYVENDAKPPLNEVIHIKRAQLELCISWHKTRSFHSALFELSDHDVYPLIMVVSVKMVSLISEYKKLHSSILDKGKTESNRNKHREKHNPSSSGRSTTSSQSNVGNTEFDEYIPIGVSNTEVNLKYTPSLKCRSSSDIPHTDEYTPITVKSAKLSHNGDVAISGACGDDGIYRPARIIKTTETSQSSSSLSKPAKAQHNKREQNKTNYDGKWEFARDQNRNENFSISSKRTKADTSSTITDQLNLSEDLFGESDPDTENSQRTTLTQIKTSQESPPAKRPAFLRQTKLKTTMSSIAETVDESSTDLLKISRPPDWIVIERTKQRSKDPKSEREKISIEHRDKKRKKDKNVTRLSPEEMEQTNAKQVQTINELKNVRAQIDEYNKPTVIDRFIDLKDMACNELLETYIEHEDKIVKLFNDYVNQSSHRVKWATDYDYISIQNILLTSEQTRKMATKLEEQFRRGDALGLNSFTDLFWQLIIPEWALAVFIKRYSMTRADALNHLRLQEKAEVENSPSFEEIKFY